MKYTKNKTGESQGYELSFDCITETKFIKINFSRITKRIRF